MPEQRILQLDSQILNSISACARKTQYQFVENLQPMSKAAALEKGSLLHDMLEIYYSIKGNCIKESAEWIELCSSAGLPVPRIENTVPHQDLVQFCLHAGELFSLKSELSPEDVTLVLKTFKEYADYYEYDQWHPLAVEEVGSKVLHESNELKVIYNFKVDLVAEKGTIIAPWDHKSGSRSSEPSSMSNQFIGYCFGLNLNYIIINKIGFQKTLPAKDKFQRYTLQISPDRIEEWKNNAVYWCLALDWSLRENQWPMNLTHCDKYSGCIYESLCSTNPEIRESKKIRDFTVGKQWDVANILEVSK